MVDRDCRAGDSEREWALEGSNNTRRTVMEGEDEEISPQSSSFIQDSFK